MANAAYQKTTTAGPTAAGYAFRSKRAGGKDGSDAMEIRLECDSASAVTIFAQVEGIHEPGAVSITSSGTTATVTHTDHGLKTGDYVTIAGATEAVFNTTAAITVTGANTYTYTMLATNNGLAATGSPTAANWDTLPVGTAVPYFRPNQGQQGIGSVLIFVASGTGTYTLRVTGK